MNRLALCLLESSKPQFPPPLFLSPPPSLFPSSPLSIYTPPLHLFCMSGSHLQPFVNCTGFSWRDSRTAWLLVTSGPQTDYRGDTLALLPPWVYVEAGVGVKSEVGRWEPLAPFSIGIVI